MAGLVELGKSRGSGITPAAASPTTLPKSPLPQPQRFYFPPHCPYNEIPIPYSKTGLVLRTPLRITCQALLPALRTAHQQLTPRSSFLKVQSTQYSTRFGLSSCLLRIPPLAPPPTLRTRTPLRRHFTQYRRTPPPQIRRPSPMRKSLRHTEAASSAPTPP